MSEEQDSISFFAKCRNWVAIKNMSIHKDTRPEEIAFHLAGIRQSIDRKAFEFLNINVGELDSFADSATKGMRKTPNSLADAGAQITSAGAKAAISKASNGDAKHEKIARVYLFRKIVQNLGLDFDVSQEMLSKIYKDLKVKKPLGRRKKA